MFQLRDVDRVLALRDADALAERPNRLRRVAAPAHAHDRRHAGIVPSTDMAFLHELEQLPLAHECVGQVEPREFDLPRARRHREVLNQPVVERAMIFEFERAQRVGDLLDRVRWRVREVVHRVDAPGVAGPMMMGAADPVEHRIAHVHVRRRHLDLRAQHVRAVFELAGAHPREQIEVLADAAVPVRTVLPWLGQRPAVTTHFVGVLAVDVREAALDQMNRVLVELFEVVRREVQARPFETEPPHVFFDRLDVLDVFRRRIRVIEPKIARPPELLRDAEVEANRFRMPDVKVAVRLRRKPCRDSRAIPPRRQVFGDALTNEVEGRPRPYGRAVHIGKRQL